MPGKKVNMRRNPFYNLWNITFSHLFVRETQFQAAEIANCKKTRFLLIEIIFLNTNIVLYEETNYT